MPAHTQSPAKADVDLADVFGTTVPSDTPGKGDREFAHEFVGRFGRIDGSYRVLDGKTQIGFGVTDWFAVTPGLTSTWASISNVTGLDNYSGVSVTGGCRRTESQGPRPQQKWHWCRADRRANDQLARRRDGREHPRPWG